MTNNRILVTGTAGFIGFHLAKLLLDEGFTVHGYDGLTDYYDVGLKKRRHQILNEYTAFSATEALLEDERTLWSASSAFNPSCVIHLAAQAGVRHSLDNPRGYISSNVVGTFNILEIARELQIEHLLIASTSSVYGANLELPFCEHHRTDAPLTIYAATKKAAEGMAHSYAHLWGIPTTVFRFFTVYGPWGRPDMALFKFVDAIINGRPIEIYNYGNMYRDFTYVSDLVRAVRLLSDIPPKLSVAEKEECRPLERNSFDAPYRIVNIGNTEKVKLLDFIDAIEEELGIEAIKSYLPLQKGDVPATWADATRLKELTGYLPNTSYKKGVREFVRWYRDYYQK